MILLHQLFTILIASIMRISRCYITLLIVLAFITLNNRVLAQQTNNTMWTPQTAKKWVKSKEWAHGLTVNIHPSVNYIEFAKQYHFNKEYWDKAFSFLSDKNLNTLAPGKYVIDGDNVYAIITEAPSKEFDQSAWESHQKYIDLQYVIKGKEKIGITPVTSATVTKPYDEANDFLNYSADGKYYIASPGEFFLFFPGDVHRPNIKVEKYDTVKKLVIKIKFTPE